MTRVTITNKNKYLKTEDELLDELEAKAEEVKKNIDRIITIANKRGLSKDSEEYMQLLALQSLFDSILPLFSKKDPGVDGLMEIKKAHDRLSTGTEWWPLLKGDYAVAVSYEFLYLLITIKSLLTLIKNSSSEATTYFGKVLRRQIGGPLSFLVRGIDLSAKINGIENNIIKKCQSALLRNNSNADEQTENAIPEVSPLLKFAEEEINKLIYDKINLKEFEARFSSIVGLISALDKNKFDEFQSLLENKGQSPFLLFKQLGSLNTKLEKLLKEPNSLDILSKSEYREIPMAYFLGDVIIFCLREFDLIHVTTIEKMQKIWISDSMRILQIAIAFTYTAFFENHSDYLKTGTLKEKLEALKALEENLRANDNKDNKDTELTQETQKAKALLERNLKVAGYENKEIESYAPLAETYYYKAATQAQVLLNNQVNELIKNAQSKLSIFLKNEINLMEKFNATHKEIKDKIGNLLEPDSNHDDLFIQNMRLKSKIIVLEKERNAITTNLKKYQSENNLSLDELGLLKNDKQVAELHEKYDCLLKAIPAIEDLNKGVESLDKLLLKNLGVSIRQNQEALSKIRQPIADVSDLYLGLQKENESIFKPKIIGNIKAPHLFRNRLADNHSLLKTHLEEYYLLNNTVLPSIQDNLASRKLELSEELNSLKEEKEDLLEQKTKLESVINSNTDIIEKNLKELSSIKAWNPLQWTYYSNLQIQQNEKVESLKESTFQLQKVEGTLTNLNQSIVDKEQYLYEFNKDSKELIKFDMEIIETANYLIERRKIDIKETKKNFLKSCQGVLEKLGVPLEDGITPDNAYSQIKELQSKLEFDGAYLSFMKQLNDISSSLDFHRLDGFATNIDDLENDIKDIEQNKELLNDVVQKIQALSALVRSTPEGLTSRINGLIDELDKKSSTILCAIGKLELAKQSFQTATDIKNNKREIDNYLKLEFSNALNAYPETSREEILDRSKRDASNLKEYADAREYQLSTLSELLEKEKLSILNIYKKFYGLSLDLQMNVDGKKKEERDFGTKLNIAQDKITEELKRWNNLKKDNFVIVGPLESAEDVKGLNLLHYKVEYGLQIPATGYENQTFMACSFVIPEKANLAGAKFDTNCEVNEWSNFADVIIDQHTQMNFSRHGFNILFHNIHLLKNDQEKFKNLLNLISDDTHLNQKYKPNASDVLEILREIGMLSIKLEEKKTWAKTLIDIMLPKIVEVSDLVKFRKLVDEKHQGNLNPYAYIREERGSLRAKYGNTKTWEYIVGKIQQQFKDNMNDNMLVTPEQYNAFYDIMKTRRTHTFGFGSLFPTVGGGAAKWKNPKGDLQTAFNLAASEQNNSYLSQYKK